MMYILIHIELFQFLIANWPRLIQKYNTQNGQNELNAIFCTKMQDEP